MKNVPENELFSAYLDGELTAEQEAQVERLLASSPAARQTLEELRALSNTLQSLPAYELDRDLAPDVLRMAERRMLGEPPPGSEAEPDRPPPPGPADADASFWKTIGRRALAPRTLFWPVTAMAVAVLLMVFGPQGLDDRAPDHEVAQAPPAADEEAPDRDDSGDRLAGAVIRPLNESGTKEGLAGLERSKANDRGAAIDGLAAGEKDRVRQTVPAEKRLAETDQGHEGKAGGRVPHRALTAGREPGQGGDLAGAGAKPGSAHERPGAADHGRGLDRRNALAGGGGPRAKRYGGGRGGDEAAFHFRRHAQTDGTMVVFCDVSPAAAREGVFDQVITDQSIQWAEHDEALDVNRRSVRPRAMGKQTQQGQGAASRLAEKKPGEADRHDTQTAAFGWAAPEDLDVVLVEASPRQIAAALAALDARPESFVSLCVAPDPAVPDQKAFLRYNRLASGESFKKKTEEAAKDIVNNALRVATADEAADDRGPVDRKAADKLTERKGREGGSESRAQRRARAMRLALPPAIVEAEAGVDTATDPQTEPTAAPAAPAPVREPSATSGGAADQNGDGRAPAQSSDPSPPVKPDSELAAAEGRPEEKQESKSRTPSSGLGGPGRYKELKADAPARSTSDVSKATASGAGLADSAKPDEAMLRDSVKVRFQEGKSGGPAEASAEDRPATNARPEPVGPPPCVVDDATPETPATDRGGDPRGAFKGAKPQQEAEPADETYRVLFVLRVVDPPGGVASSAASRDVPRAVSSREEIEASEAVATPPAARLMQPAEGAESNR